MRWRARLLAGVLAAPFVAGAAMGASAAGPAGGSEVCSFTDPEIDEASGLVRTGGVFVTMNDSGDTARAFAVDPHTCDTVGTTRWGARAIDQESLAPTGRSGEVWVGDTGDNFHSRDYVTVAKVPVGRGDRTVPGEVYKLAYPDGPHDAETLLRDPRTGQLFVVAKEFIGRIYAAPLHLHAGINTMTAGKSVLGIATDGAFFPDGRHIVLRNYGQAAFYTWPGLARIATVDLPRQQQGEGLAVADDGRIYLSSEGGHAPVLELHLPASVKTALATEHPPSQAPAPGSPGRQDTSSGSDQGWPWLAGGALALVVLAFGLGARAYRRR